MFGRLVRPVVGDDQEQCRPLTQPGHCGKRHKIEPGAENPFSGKARVLDQCDMRIGRQTRLDQLGRDLAGRHLAHVDGKG